MYPYDYTFSSLGVLQHYGKPRRSGRYPFGSGEDPYQSITRGRLSNHKKKKLIKKAKARQAEHKKKQEEEAKKPKTLSEMSNDEVREMISRLKLEKEYKDALAALQPKEIPKETKQKGKSFVGAVVRDAGKKAAVTVLTATFTYAGGSFINKVSGKPIVKINSDEKDKK